MMSLLARLIRSPRTVAVLLYDRVWLPQWLLINGLRSGRNCRFAGRPVIQLGRAARIRLGNNILINSRYDSNVAGLPHPTILAAVGDHSYIDIGDGTGISGASIVARLGITIGKRVLVGAGACIWDTDFHPVDPASRREHQTRGARCAPVVIEDEVFIGARALVLKGVTVGRGAVIAAGAVVAKDVAPGEIVAGNPARVVGSVIVKREESSSYENVGHRL